jgi:hypothetical protein
MKLISKSYPYANWCMDTRCGNENFCHVCPICTIHIKEPNKKGTNYTKHISLIHPELVVTKVSN